MGTDDYITPETVEERLVGAVVLAQGADVEPAPRSLPEAVLKKILPQTFLPERESPPWRSPGRVERHCPSQASGHQRDPTGEFPKDPEKFLREPRISFGCSQAQRAQSPLMTAAVKRELCPLPPPWFPVPQLWRDPNVDSDLGEDED